MYTFLSMYISIYLYTYIHTNRKGRPLDTNASRAILLVAQSASVRTCEKGR